ncbi:hypothetical protein [Candidatus Uabimicrobium sp. HlEnr_7]|uniref:hypothetical protein n=1 Tax=Candidatus Uabimicrobium helgolandensis TaxID=3095367 RepID=UPI003558CF74
MSSLINYRERFQSMVDELIEHPQIEVIRYKIDKASKAAPYRIKFANEYLQKLLLPPLTKDLVAFYSECSRIRLEWRLKSAPPNRNNHGNIDIEPINRVFDSWRNCMPNEFKALHPFDFFIEEACVALNLNGDENPMLHFHRLGHGGGSMGIDISGYLELLLKSRGFWYWQTSIVGGGREEQEFRDTMPKLFPDYRDSDFVRIV